MSFTNRAIDVTVTIAQGPTGDIAGPPILLSGRRVSAHIAVMGGESQGQAQIGIYGLTRELMNQLTTIGPIASAVRTKNTVQLDAGDKGGVLTTVYLGTVWYAWADYSVPAEPVLNISALAAVGPAVKPAPAQSFPGSADVATMMAQLAAGSGLKFENNGVQARLQDQYLPNTALEQIKRIARAAGIRYVIDNGVLAIWPFDGFRKGDIPLISPDTGMVGYPSFSEWGPTVKSVFIPGVKLGGQVQIKSSLTPACGTWKIHSIIHDLVAETPGGDWFTTISAMGLPGG